MLARYYRFYIVNNSGETLTYNNDARLEIRFTPWKFTSAGALVYGAVAVDTTGLLDAAGTIADGASSEGAVRDNTSDLYLGGHGYLECKHDVDTAAGARIDLWVESCDDNASWPSDQDDFDDEIDATHIASLDINTSAVDKTRGCNFAL